MTGNHDNRSASPTDLAAAPQAGAASPPARLDPTALTVAQLARLLGVPEEKVREHAAGVAPASADGRINLVHYTAWLNRQLKERDGD